MDLLLSAQRCWTHPAREAAARCPSCARFFCRECVTEHEGRVLCAACLRASLGAVRAPRVSRRWGARLGRGAQLAGGLFLAWLFFYGLGRSLLALPEKFHEGSLWVERILGPDAGANSGGDNP